MPSNQQVRYFDRFGTVDYDFTNENALARMTDLTKFIQATDRGEISSYLYYDIQPEDRPETIAYNIYGKSEYAWMIFMLNPRLHTGMNAWPLTDYEFEKYIEREFDPYCWISGAHIDETADVDVANYIGNIPLNEKYLPHLYITTSRSTEENDANFALTELKIKSYDYERLGLVVEKNSNSDVLDLQLNLDTDDYLGITHDNSELGQEWAAKCNSLRGMGILKDEPGFIRRENYYGENQHRDVFKFSSARRFSNAALKYATYRYYIDRYDDDALGNGVLVPFRLLTHNEVIRNAVEPGIKLVELNDPGYFDDDPALINLDFISKVSFYQNERDDNDAKKKIKLPRQEIATDIARRYYNLLKRF